MPGAEESCISPGRLRALVLCFCHPFYLEAATEFAAVLRDAGNEVIFCPSPEHGWSAIVDVLSGARFDIVAYFGHGGRDGWHGYFGGLRLPGLQGIRKQKLVISMACNGLDSVEGSLDSFGAKMVVLGLVECFLGSMISTDSNVGRVYMLEFARALVQDGGRVEDLHGKAKEASRKRMGSAATGSLEALRIVGDGSVILRIPENLSGVHRRDKGEALL